MAPTTVGDELKLLYAVLQVSGAKANMSDVAAFMGLKTGATSMRYSTLIRKLQKQFGEVKGGMSASAASTPKTPTPNKRKRDKKDASDSTPSKKVKGEDEESSADTQEAANGT